MSCLSCKLADREYMEDTVHLDDGPALSCFFCGYIEKCILHPETKSASGECYECSQCNRYIVYTVNNVIYKDEMILSDGSYLTRNLETNESYFFKEAPIQQYFSDESITIPQIIIGYSEEEIIEKIQLYLTFS